MNIRIEFSFYKRNIYRGRAEAPPMPTKVADGIGDLSRNLIISTIIIKKILQIYILNSRCF